MSQTELPMGDDITVGFTELLAEVERETATRIRVFPRWIEQGRLKRRTAQIRIARLRAVSKILHSINSSPSGITAILKEPQTFKAEI